MHANLRDWFATHVSPDVANSIRIIYGGMSLYKSLTISSRQWSLEHNKNLGESGNIQETTRVF